MELSFPWGGEKKKIEGEIRGWNILENIPGDLFIADLTLHLGKLNDYWNRFYLG